MVLTAQAALRSITEALLFAAVWVFFLGAGNLVARRHELLAVLTRRKARP